MAALNSEQVSELYTAVAEQITRLYDQSEAAGNDVEINPARTHFLALSGYLSSHGILDALNVYADYLSNPDAYPSSTPKELPVF